MPARVIPTQTQILVIGGGPAGSYAATALAREGFQVTLFEAAKFPRYHIGESLLPSMNTFLGFIGVLDQIKAHDFCRKPGASVKFTHWKREAYTDFGLYDFDNGAYNVIRSEFDDILLRHASVSGVAVFEQVKATSITFKNDNLQDRPIACQYEHVSSSDDGVGGTIHFDYLVDATGRNALMSQKYLKNRHYNKNLDNIACWGYWTGCKRYSPGTDRENAVYLEAMQDETGWAWFIPLHDGTVSVGVVQNQTAAAEKKRLLRKSTDQNSAVLTAHYLHELQQVPGVLKYIGENGKLVETGKDGGPGVRQAADFSYSAKAYSGPGFRLAGDASAFIDPFFSSGVHLAFTGALSAAATISSSIRGQASEEECAKWHDTKVGVAYTRFLLVVLSAYKQMRAQTSNVLSDVNEDNFDRAFDIIRPIIQGTAEVGQRLSEDNVQNTMEFLKNIFNPTDPEMHAAVHARVDPKFFGLGVTSSDILTEKDLDKLIDPSDQDARHVIARENARKPVHDLYNAEKNFVCESFDGWAIELKRGELGLVSTTEQS